MSDKAIDDVTIDGDRFKILINDDGQYSLWPAAKVAPAGWMEIGERGTKAQCLAEIETRWTDMRPKSLLIRNVPQHEP